MTTRHIKHQSVDAPSRVETNKIRTRRRTRAHVECVKALLLKAEQRIHMCRVVRGGHITRVDFVDPPVQQQLQLHTQLEVCKLSGRRTIGRREGVLHTWEGAWAEAHG